MPVDEKKNKTKTGLQPLQVQTLEEADHDIGAADRIPPLRAQHTGLPAANQGLSPIGHN